MNNCSFMSRKFVALGNWRWVIKNHQDSTDLFFIDLIPLIVPHFRFHVKSIHLKSIWFAHVFHLSTIWHVFSRCRFFVLDFTRAYQIHIYIFNMNMSKLTRRFFESVLLMKVCLARLFYSCGLNIKDVVTSLKPMPALFAHWR